MTEASVVVPDRKQAPKLPILQNNKISQEAERVKESLKIGIREKASTPHLVVNNRITKDGKAIAAGIYKEELEFGANTGQFVEAAKFIRQDLREEVASYRKDAKASVLASIATEGKTRRQIGAEEFKHRVRDWAAGDTRVQEVQAMRKLLSSVVQRAKNSDVSEIRLKLKGEVTDAEIDVRMQQLQALRAEGKIKRVPGRELVRNALAERRRKALRESLQAQEHREDPSQSKDEPPTFPPGGQAEVLRPQEATTPQPVEQPIAPSLTPAEAAPAPVPEAPAADVKPAVEVKTENEQHNIRVSQFVQRMKGRLDLLSSSRTAHMFQRMINSGQYGVNVIRDIAKNVARKPLAATFAGLAIAGVLGLQNPQAAEATIESIARAVSTPGPSVSRQVDVSTTRSYDAPGPMQVVVQRTLETPPQPLIVESVAPAITTAHAEFSVNAPTLYLMNGQKAKEIPKGEMQIHKLSDAKGEYMVEVTFPNSSNPTQTYKVPIEQIANVEGKLDKEAAFQHPLYEIRNDKKDLMGEVVASGASGVRIEAQDWDITKDIELREKLEEARKHNLRILYVFNSTHSLPEAEIKRLLKPVIQNYVENDKLEIEIGNEVDNDTVPFWPDFYDKFNKSGGRVVDFKSFADQAARTIKVINEIDKELRRKSPTPKVIGALVDPDGKQIPYTNEIRQASKNLGVNIDDPSILWGNHTYQEVADVPRRISALKRAGIPANKQRFTEIGVTGKTKPELLQMVKMIIEKTRNRATVHELPNENPLEEDMGFVQRKDPSKPTEVVRNAAFYQMLKFFKDMGR